MYMFTYVNTCIYIYIYVCVYMLLRRARRSPPLQHPLPPCASLILVEVGPTSLNTGGPRSSVWPSVCLDARRFEKPWAHFYCRVLAGGSFL